MASPLVYRDFEPKFQNRADWALPTILRRQAREHRGKVFLDVPFEDVRLSYESMLELSERVASGLLADGAAPGDRLLIMAPNSSRVMLTWFGAALAGLVEVPINTAYTGSFLEHQVRTTAPRFAVIDAEYAECFAEGAGAYQSIERFYLLGSSREAVSTTLRAAGWNAAPFEELLEEAPRALPDVSPRDLAAIFFTSGTTGLSKGVMMPHAHMTFFAEEARALTRLTDSDVYMSVGPLFHGNAQFCAAYPALIAGARFVLREKFSASGWARQIGECKATVTNLVGVMMDWAWKQPRQSNDGDNNLRCVWAVPTASSYVDAFKQRYGIEAVVENFGLTETAMPILCPYDAVRPSGACGVVVDEWFDVRLVDPETDEEVPVGEVGELVIRPKAPWIMSPGYYGMPERTVEAFRNLWFHTGDGLKRDAAGWYYFVDRLKDAMRRRGENISSFEVEAAVLEHDAVGACAAIAVPAAEEAGEDEVMLFVVAKAEVTRAQIAAWCEERLPVFARPRYIRLVENLPTTPSGKVQKAILRELAPSASLAVDLVE